MKIAAALLLLLLSVASSAQMKQGKLLLDSLLSELPGMADDSNGVKLLVDISYGYSFTNPDEGLKYAERALVLAKKTKWRRGEAYALNDIGNSYRNKASFPLALDYYFKALRIFEELSDKKFTGKVFGNIGAVHFSQGEHQKALEYYFKGLKTVEEIDDKHAQITINGNIGNVYYAQGNYGDALTYMQKSLRIAEDTGDRRGIMNQWGNIGTVYGELGDNEKALTSYFKALRIAEEEHDLQIIAANEGNIGETYLDIVKDTTKPLTAPGKSANLEKAATWLQKGIAAAREGGYNEYVIGFLQTLSEVYAMQGDHRSALQAYHQFTALKDSTFSIENNEKIAGLETKRAVELKDKDIQIARLEVAKKRNERYFFIAGIALLLAIMGILFRSYRRQQHTNALLSKEKKRSDDLLLNILPSEVADELKEKGGADARQFDEVTVLFTDFVDFTGTAEHLSPKALVKELHECFTAFDAIIERNGLEKIKTIGDAYMAVCGLPISQPQHAVRTVQAALEIVHFMKERRTRQKTFEIRIGINSGSVVAGIVGVKKFAYDIWGDAVNTAARMEQHGIAGTINISQSTYELVKDDFICDYRGKIAAKSKGNVEMYLVAARVEQAAPTA